MAIIVKKARVNIRFFILFYHLVCDSIEVGWIGNGANNWIDKACFCLGKKKHPYHILDTVYFTPKFSFLFSETFIFFSRIEY